MPVFLSLTLAVEINLETTIYQKLKTIIKLEQKLSLIKSYLKETSSLICPYELLFLPFNIFIIIFIILHSFLKDSFIALTTEELQPFKWENAMTIDEKSWGFRADAPLRDYLTIEELIETLVETVR